MNTIKMKTNIMCSSCVAKVTPGLNEVAGQETWKVDIGIPDKILTVNAEGVTAEEVISAVQKAGYKAENID